MRTFFFIPIDLYRPLVRIYVHVCVCVCVCVCVYVWEREKLLMKRLSIIHYQFVFPSPFLDHSYREFFVSVHLLSTHTHTSLHKLNGSDRHAMSVVVIVRLWKKTFFLLFSVNSTTTKTDRDIFHSFFTLFCLSIFLFLSLSRHELTSNIHPGLHVRIFQQRTHLHVFLLH